MRIKRKKKWSLWNSGNRSLGIELTDHYIKLVELSAKGSLLQIHFYDREPIPAGVVEEGRIVDLPSAVVLLQQVIARNSLATKQVHAVLPSALIMVRYLKLPDLPNKELRKVIDFEVKHNLHLPFDEPVYDFLKQNGSEAIASGMKRPKKLKQVKDKHSPAEEALVEAAATGTGADTLFAGFDDPKPEEDLCDVLLVASPKDLVDEYRSLFETAGLKLRSLEIKSFSLFRLLEASEEPWLNGTFLMVDVNATVSDLTIYSQNQLKITRSIPIVFDEAPSSKQEAEAEQNLVYFTFAETSEDASFEAALNELGHELERLMNFYRYSLNNRNQVFDRLILHGDVSRLDDIAHYLSDRLNLEIEFARLKELRADVGFTEKLRQLAVPVGLALRGRSD